MLLFTIPSSKLILTTPPPPLKLSHFFTTTKTTTTTTLYPNSRKPLTLVLCKADDEQQHQQHHHQQQQQNQELCGSEEWLKKLPEKSKPLYSHSLPCIEAWLISLEFHQSKDDRAVWFVEKPDWHAQLSLDVTDIFVRYLKSGPGNLEKDVERRFSYALSREDIENAVLGGP